jgi:hypothetical protein
MIIKVKGYELDIKPITNSFDRRATRLRNKIIESLRRIGIDPEYIDISEERNALKKAPIKVSWYSEERYCYYSYNQKERYIENLQVATMLIEAVAHEVAENLITLHEFTLKFEENKEVDKERIEARKTLGLDENCKDLKEINTRFKELSRKYHPDMPEGDIIKFKEINTAHKLLKKELE